MSTLDDLLVASGKVREIYDLGDDRCCWSRPTASRPST